MTDPDFGLWQPPTGKLPPQPYDAPGLQEISAHMQLEWRWNLRSRTVEHLDRSRPDPIWERATDRTHARFRDRAQRFYTTLAAGNREAPWNPSNIAYERALNAAIADNEVDPFLDWLENLPDWDATDRCETLLTDLFGIEPDELTRWASRYPMLAAVERTYRPGAKIDEHPVLFGPQGAGKSAMYERLLPERARPEWHGDGVELDATLKEQAEALAGRVIVEIPELSGYKRAEIRKMKGFLTRKNDGQHRSAWARSAEPSPRRCAIVLTANPEEARLPNDPSGNRRFVSIEIEAATGPVEPVIDAIRDQLWAETLHKHLVTEEWATAQLPRALKTVQETVNAEFRDNDDAYEALLAQLHAPAPATLNEIGSAVGVNATSAAHRLTTALRNQKWVYNPKQVRRKGAIVRLWHPPHDQPDYKHARYVIGRDPRSTVGQLDLDDRHQGEEF